MEIKNLSRERVAWTVATLVGIVLLGYLSEFFVNFRVDFTETGQYTLSDATAETLEKLDDKVVIKAVFSEDLPAQFALLKTQVKDLLKEFESAGKGKVQLRFEDPGLDSARKAAVLGEGIREIQVTERSRDGAVAKRGFFGMTISYLDKKDVVPMIESLESFEYDLVVRIKKLTSGRQTIGIVEGTGEGQLQFVAPGRQPSVQKGFRQVFPSLAAETQKLYNLVLVDAAQPLPDSIALLLVAAPRKLSEVEKFNIEQFLLQGRNLIFLSPALDIDLSRGLQARVADPGYFDMLKTWGFEMEKNILLDVRHGTANFGLSPFGTSYPYFPLIQGEELHRKNVVTANLGGLLLPWVSSVKTPAGEDPNKAGIRTEILARTTDKAWEEKAPFQLRPKDPSRGERYLPGSQRSFDIVVMRRGRFPSHFSGKAPVGVSGEKFLAKAKDEAAILVIPGFLFASDFFVRWSSQVFGQNSMENLLLLVNAFDYLALDPQLIEIRTKGFKVRPIQKEGFESRKFWVAFNLLFAPFLVLLVAVVVSIRRRRREGRVYL